MKKVLSVLLVVSLSWHYPILSASANEASAHDSHSLLPISKVRTFWFIPNTQTGTMAYSYPCNTNCVDSRIVSLMPDIDVVVYANGSISYWVDTETGCHYSLPDNKPKQDEDGKNICVENRNI